MLYYRKLLHLKHYGSAFLPKGEYTSNYFTVFTERYNTANFSHVKGFDSVASFLEASSASKK